MESVWGYDTFNGPNNWHKNYPVAKEGKRQSPIDIDSSKAEKITQNIPIKAQYIPDNTIDIENTGASWKVNVKGEGSSLTGGDLKDEYQLWQFHAHWGSKDQQGSEHTVNGNCYPAELHLVHWNKTKYSSPSEAADKPDGLAVLGMFMEIGEKHEEFDKVVQALKKIKHKGQTHKFENSLDPAKLLPSNLEFWTYEGSLTTPPLLESVIWTVFKEPIKISRDQLQAMRELKFCCEGEEGPCMVDNYRPPVPFGSRTLRQI